MRQIPFQQFDELWAEVEAAVDATPEIDPWCSGPDWLIPVASGFAPTTERLLFATDQLDGFALFARYVDAGPVILGGLEPLWGFGTPIIGANPARVARQLVPVLEALPDWEILLLTGMPTVSEADATPAPVRLPPVGGVSLSVAMALSALGSVSFGEGITRRIADLSDGYDAWLDRRSARFRRNLRQATARAEQAGLEYEDVSEDADLFDRLMAVEHQTWKGREGSGITSVEMTAMYRQMVDRLRTRGRLLANVARLDGEDVGYILGGVRAGRYRGLQLSFIEPVHHLSVGNLLQKRQLRQLDSDGLATIYDLGMDFDYKRRWSDRTETSLTMIVRRSELRNQTAI